ncbi:hypothetical protein, partial [Burkholderia vietnamiensis]|uniref:hypothetical protein n=1 Tax=Burkholderia vietnamiensis TaxID=60552 RepID=UPI001E4B7D80
STARTRSSYEYMDYLQSSPRFCPHPRWVSSAWTSTFRTVESADSTVQAIVMYRSGGALYAVQATKTGADAPDLYVKPAPVNFKVYRFNGNLDVARFKLTQTSRSKATYMNAGDALTKEFFSR